MLNTHVGESLTFPEIEDPAICRIVGECDPEDIEGTCFGATYGSFAEVTKNIVASNGFIATESCYCASRCPRIAVTNLQVVCSPHTLDITSAVYPEFMHDDGTLTYWEDPACTTTPILDPTAVGISGTYYVLYESSECSIIKPIVVSIVNCPKHLKQTRISILGVSTILEKCMPSGVPIGIILDIGDWIKIVDDNPDCCNDCWEVVPGDCPCPDDVPVFLLRFTNFAACDAYMILEPTYIKPGFKESCDPVKVQTIKCDFADAIYNEMVKLRFGVNICCDVEEHKTYIRNELFELERMRDPNFYVTIVDTPCGCC